MNLLINANAKQIPLADNSVNCVVTSPPYFGLRDYGTAEWVGGDAECDHIAGLDRPRSERPLGSFHGGSDLFHTTPYRDVCGKCGAIRVDNQIGLEQTPDDYVDAMVAVFREVWRVLRDDGVVFLNLGDSYAGAGPNRESDKRSSGANTGNKPRPTGSLKPKDLIGIPWRVAFALQADGWWLRQDIIWHKPNPMPESVKDRCTKAHEYIFLLTKSARYWYDNEAIKEPQKDISIRRAYSTNNVEDRKDADIDELGYAISGKAQDETYRKMREKIDNGWNPTRNKRSVWTVTTKPYPGSHYAVFPPDLIEPCILAGCPEGGVVLDPFIGSGTTAMVARKHRRNAIGLDLNFKYLTTNARERLQYGSYVPIADGITQLTLG